MLLPNKHYITDLVIVAHHASVHHKGIRETLNSVRERYWIVRGREAVKRVTRAFRVCSRYEGKPFVAQCFPQLPASRVSDAPPFTNAGSDFAGPFYVKSNRQVEMQKHKAYVCLPTCASTRAVHSELVPSLTVSAFLQAFRRFVARRGLPARLLSDNAKIFKAAAKEFLKITRQGKSNVIWRIRVSSGNSLSRIINTLQLHRNFQKNLINLGLLQALATYYNSPY